MDKNSLPPSAHTSTCNPSSSTTYCFRTFSAALRLLRFSLPPPEAVTLIKSAMNGLLEPSVKLCFMHDDAIDRIGRVEPLEQQPLPELHSQPPRTGRDGC